MGLICSTSSASSPSNISLRTRKRSRTSSAGGDFLSNGKDCRNNFGHNSGSKIRHRSSKYHGLLPRNVKCLKKPAAKPSKSIKPNFGNLQNAVVLAPFHTLKRCFQSKLIDLYAYEKMKKNTNKMRMAKKKNLSFEYDVIELKSQKNVKKSDKEIKVHKPKKTDKQTKRKRSESYCMCDKATAKGNKPRPKIVTDDMKKQQIAPNASLPGSPIQDQNPFSIELENKKRRLDDLILSANNLRNDFEAKLSLIKSGLDTHARSDTNISVAGLSSHSQVDSWETFSDVFSNKEQHLEGSLVISTTSLESCLEQCDKDVTEYSGSSLSNSRGSRSKTKCNSPLNVIGDEQGNQKTQIITSEFPPKPQPSESRHLIMNMRTRSSDGQITDFMDREPQAQLISSAEVSQHLQPLRRQSKTKTKKRRSESETTKLYYLRSACPSCERIRTIGESDYSTKEQTCNQERKKSREPSMHTEATFDPGLKKEPNKTVHVTVAKIMDLPQGEEIQAIITTAKETMMLSARDQSEDENQMADITLESPQPDPPVESNLDKMVTLRPDKDCTKSDVNDRMDSHNTTEVLPKRRSASVAREPSHLPDMKTMTRAEIDSPEVIQEEINTDNNRNFGFLNGEVMDTSIIMEPSDQPLEFFQSAEEGLVERSLRPSGQNPQLEDKESNFIFGPRSTSAMRESY